jgi:hypothetical protein
MFRLKKAVKEFHSDFWWFLCASPHVCALPRTNVQLAQVSPYEMSSRGGEASGAAAFGPERFGVWVGADDAKQAPSITDRWSLVALLRLNMQADFHYKKLWTGNFKRTTICS